MLVRFAIVENGVCTNISEAEEAFGIFMGWIASETAQMGDLWDGTSFTTPPPPVPTQDQYETLFKNFMLLRAQTIRNGICAQILAANPSVNSVSSFLAACDAWTGPWE